MLVGLCQDIGTDAVRLNCWADKRVYW